MIFRLADKYIGNRYRQHGQFFLLDSLYGFRIRLGVRIENMVVVAAEVNGAAELRGLSDLGVEDDPGE